jgi:hypothetical protein
VVKLIYYVLTDKNGTFIRKDDGSGKYVTIRNERFAARFDNRAKAKNVLDNSIGKTIRSRFHVVEMEDAPVVKDEPQIQAPTFDNVLVRNLTAQEKPKSSTGKWMAGIDRITEFLTDAETRKQELIGKLSEADRKITDIHHYLEFVSFNCYQGWLLSDLLRTTLAERRRIKDEIAVLENFKNHKLSVETMQEIKAAVDGLGKREYTPRVLTELFGGVPA